MSTYVRQSSCSTFEIPTQNGSIKVHGGPLNPSVIFPVSDQTMINTWCDQNPQFKTPGAKRQCQNFYRNNNLVNFVTTEANTLGSQNTQIMIQKLQLCQSEDMNQYLQWRNKNKNFDNSQITNITTVCNF